MILIGTSGFSYDDWVGRFYPKGLERRAMLGYYAQHFDVVEVDATYYRLLPARTFDLMQQKVPAGFLFAVKANREMTHGGEDRPEVFEQFKQSLQPLLRAEKFGCVLAQFPFAFQWTSENQRSLLAFKQRLSPLPLVVEFRNAAWANAEVFDFLRSESIGYCCVDEPRLKGLMPPVAIATSPIAYLRFHGRNRAKWWRHQHAYERYDYLYAPSELREWAPKIQRLAAEADPCYVFFNNHYQAKGIANAQQLRELLGIAPPQAVPANAAPTQTGTLFP